jgi:hypothetical protein
VRRSLALVPLLLLVPVALAPAQAPPATQDVCADPTLRCPDLTMAPPSDLSLARSPGGRLVLRAENRIVNVGRGPVEVRAFRGTYGGSIPAVQVIQRTDGRPPLRVAGAGRVTYKFVDRGRGSYWKFDRAARFELWTRRADGTRGRLVRTGPKLAYCLRDLERRRTWRRVPRDAVYGPCSQARGAERLRLGTSAGWADVYPASYPENWIAVGGLRGCFDFVHRADPGDGLRELREDNNTGSRVIALPPRRGSVAPRGRC